MRSTKAAAHSEGAASATGRLEGRRRSRGLALTSGLKLATQAAAPSCVTRWRAPHAHPTQEVDVGQPTASL